MLRPGAWGLRLRAQAERLATHLSNRRWFVLSQALGYIFLSLLHLWQSLPEMEQRRVFPLGGYLKANPLAEIFQFLTLSYLFTIYALTLRYWSRLNLKPPDLVWAGSLLGALAWSALPTNSSDILMYVAYGRMAGVDGANPYC
jgi:hypothetical protein